MKPFVKLAVAIPGVCLVGALVTGPASATPTPPPPPKSTGNTFNGDHGTVGNVQGGHGNIYLEGTGHTVGNVSNTITAGSPDDIIQSYPICIDILNGTERTIALLSNSKGFQNVPEQISPGTTIRNVCTEGIGWVQYGDLGGVRVYSATGPDFYVDQPATFNGRLLTLRLRS